MRRLFPALAVCFALAAAPAAPAPSAAAPSSPRDPVAAFDGDAMWIWQVARSEGGDPAAIVARARAAGLEYVVVKAAQGPQWWPQFSPAFVAALKAGGLRVCAYQRALGRRPAEEARVFARAVGAGADCLVVDAEIEYERRYAQAQRYVDTLRDAVGDAFPVALTTFPYVHFHRAFPYSVFLGPRGAQVTMPQVYWKLIGTDPSRAFANTWPLNAIYGRPIRPLGQAFARPGRAAILRFRRLARQHLASGVGWWVWQHATPADWSAIAAPLTVAQRFVPPPTLVPATLRPGQSGDPVRWLQLKLRDHGLAVPLTARFDARTSAAVTRFKSTRLLDPLPAVDASTWSALLTPSSGPLDALPPL